VHIVYSLFSFLLPFSFIVYFCICVSLFFFFSFDATILVNKDVYNRCVFKSRLKVGRAAQMSLSVEDRDSGDRERPVAKC